jgi:hypothetical protein
MDMQTQQKINQLTRERDERRSALQQLSSQLSAAEDHFRSTRNEADGRTVLDLEGRVRLAELAFEGVERDLRTAAHPAEVAITGTRESLLERRDRIVQQMEYRESQRQLQIEHYTGGVPPERWNANIKATLRNLQLEPASFGHRREVERDLEQIAHIVAQLAVLDDRDNEQEQQPEESDHGVA